jgi:hypothetical protein
LGGPPTFLIARGAPPPLDNAFAPQRSAYLELNVTDLLSPLVNGFGPQRSAYPEQNVTDQRVAIRADNYRCLAAAVVISAGEGSGSGAFELA